ncbi:Pycsar system effector family protein [Streptomyces monticola]|uniref:Pycsar system effector family protein n=1 Tax=Streptomyces monticola TaxID=2666263 RepID=A0ABW2JUM6_9ACTN
MTATTPDPQSERDQARIAATVASLQGDLARTETKASLLLALTGAALVVLVTTATAADVALPVAAAVAGWLGAFALLAATVVLLLAIRPHLGGSGWTSWPRLADDELRQRLSTGYQVEHLRFMAALAARKFQLIRVAVDCVIAGIALLTLASVLGAVA